MTKFVGRVDFPISKEKAHELAEKACRELYNIANALDFDARSLELMSLSTESINYYKRPNGQLSLTYNPSDMCYYRHDATMEIAKDKVELTKIQFTYDNVEDRKQDGAYEVKKTVARKNSSGGWIARYPRANATWRRD